MGLIWSEKLLIKLFSRTLWPISRRHMGLPNLLTSSPLWHSISWKEYFNKLMSKLQRRAPLRERSLHLATLLKFYKKLSSRQKALTQTHLTSKNHTRILKSCLLSSHCTQRATRNRRRDISNTNNSLARVALLVASRGHDLQFFTLHKIQLTRTPCP